MSNLPDRLDVKRAYQLFLGRAPESQAVIQEMIRHATEDWLGGFICSDEFKSNVRDPLIKGCDLPSTVHAVAASPELTNWAADTLPLADQTRSEVRRCTEWRELFRLILTDSVFAQDALAGEFDDELINALSTSGADDRRLHRAVIDAVRPGDVIGWVSSARDDAPPVRVELWIDDRFVSADTPDTIRRDLQEESNELSPLAFRLPFRPSDVPHHGTHAEVRLATSGEVLATTLLSVAPLVPQDAVASIRQELTALRATMMRIEAALPDLHHGLSYPLDAYDAYYRANTATIDPGVAANASLAVIFDAIDVPVSLLAISCDALMRQNVQPAHLVIVHGDATAAAEVKAAAKAVASRWPAVDIVAAQGKEWAAAILEAVALTNSRVIVFSRADGLMESDACSRLAEAIMAGDDMAFADEDHVDLSANGAILRYRDPVLRTKFDHDLLLAGNSVGVLIAISKSHLERVGIRRESGEAWLYDFLLRAYELVDVHGFRHLSKVLWHRARADDPVSLRARMLVLESHLARTGVNAVAERHADSLGATVAGATQVNRGFPAPIRAAIIIPTRDRLDLLGPCLASVAACAARSQAAIETVIVDNQSMAGGTKAFLEAASNLGAIRVVDHDGPFNWALANNVAAANVSADVYVFLNNDTVALDHRCWDELCVQAMRPEVGAVGARLLYEDGTIQHAGVVTGDWFGFARHEGVGQPGSSPGYLGRHALTRQVTTVTGACLATRADVFAAMGGFDERLPVEGSDTDYCLKLRSAGYRVIYHPPATLYHFESKSRGYNLSEPKKQRGAVATEILRERWQAAFNDDPFYNAHFDRLSDPCTRLRPLSAGASGIVDP